MKGVTFSVKGDARMNKTLLVACAVAGGLFVALGVPPPAQALPGVNLGIEKNADAVTPVARRGGGFHRRGGFRRHRFRHGRFNRLRFRHGRFDRLRFRHGRFSRHRFRRGRFSRDRFRRGRFGRFRFGGRRFRRLRRYYYGYRPYVVGPPVAYGYYGGRCVWPCRRICVSAC